MSKEIMSAMLGAWEGNCRTWFEPGKLADESSVQGEIRALLDGRFFRHTYTGSMQGKPRKGEETFTLNTVTQQFQVVWLDDFHMNYAFLFSVGPASERGFTVTGHYDVAPGTPPWGWKTVYELKDHDHLTITAYNIMPEGEETLAVVTQYLRVGP